MPVRKLLPTERAFRVRILCTSVPLAVLVGCFARWLIDHPALRIISISFLFAGYCIVSSSVFQALGHGVLSLVVSVVRQLMVLLPVAFLLSRVGGLDLVWWAFPIAELFAVALCTAFLRRVYKKEIYPPAQDNLMI